MGQLMTAMMNAPAKWISQESWQECHQLSNTIPAFAGICSHIASNLQYWLKFSNATDPFKFLSEFNEEDPTLGW